MTRYRKEKTVPVKGQTPNDGDSFADMKRAEHEAAGEQEITRPVTSHSSTGAGANPKTVTGTLVEPNDPGSEPGELAADRPAVEPVAPQAGNTGEDAEPVKAGKGSKAKGSKAKAK